MTNSRGHEQERSDLDSVSVQSDPSQFEEVSWGSHFIFLCHQHPPTAPDRTYRGVKSHWLLNPCALQ